MKREFDDFYGTDEKDIENWHKLCYVLRIEPAPDTLRECRDVSCRFSDTLSLSSERVFLCTGCPYEKRQSC